MDPFNTSSKSEMIESRYADSIDFVGPQGVFPQLPIAKVSTVDGRSRAWRITFERIERRDRFAFNAPNDPGASSVLVPGQGYSFTAGLQSTPQIPPRRSNPIFSAANPGNGASTDPLWAQVVWGMNEGRQARLLGNWPLLGGSLVVEGAYVEVYGTTQLTGGVPPVDPNSFPNFAAHVTPIDGTYSTDSNELGISQRVPLPTAIVGAQAILLAGSTIGTGPEGFTTSLGAGSAMLGSAVFNTAPFTTWNTGIAARRPFSPRPVQVVVFTALTVPQFALQDNAVPSGAGVFVSSPGNVGIIYRTDGVGTGQQTIGAMEALITTSTIIQVVQPDTAPAHILTPEWSRTFPAGAPNTTGLGTGLIGAPTQGASVYVPDFARRVRVVPVTKLAIFAGNEFRVPTPPPSLVVNFYDDYGNVVDSSFQGTVEDSTPSPECAFPFDWITVPSSATMMSIYPGDTGSFTYDSVQINWRVAP